MSYHAIHLDDLPKPNVLAPIEPETVLSELKAELLTQFPPSHPVAQALELESEPINKVLQVLAYRYSLKVAQINHTARQLMLAYATGGDLDHIGATYYRLARKLIQEADPTTYPPTPAIYESDDAYRYRLALSIESLTRAGSAGSYEFHALSASPEVYSVAVHSPSPCVVDVYLAGQITGDVFAQKVSNIGVSASAIASVQNALSADDVRPLTDVVRVQNATAKTYQIRATIYTKNSLSPSLILQKSLADLRTYLTDNFRPSERVATSRIIGALDTSGVSRIELHEPTADVLVDIGQLALCTLCEVNAKSEGT